MNQYLKDKKYKIPSDVLKSIQTALISTPTGNGVKRAKFMLNNGVITYQGMKKLMHDFDYNNFADVNQYALAGGNQMKAFIDSTLQQDRDAVKRSKNVRQDMHVDVNLGTKAYQTPRLNEEKKDREEPQKNAVAIIIDNDNKFLLLKRSKESDWMPGKWSLVGGAIHDENPQKGIEREIKEETGLTIEKFIKTFTLKRRPNSVEHVFACRYEGDPTDIILDEENTNYGWYTLSEMKFLDIVPNLIEYINMSFKKYD